MGRVADRTGFDDKSRLTLLESDADKHDELFENLERRMAKIQAILVSILVSVSTASILLALNLVVGGK